MLRLLTRTAAPASTPFGSNPAPTAPGAFGASAGGGGFSFGSAAPAAAPGLFGGAPSFAATPQPQPQPQPTPSFLSSPAAQQLAPTQPAVGATASTLQPERELAHIQLALRKPPQSFPEQNPSYRFRALLTNIVSEEGQRRRPNGVDELTWREAVSECGGERNDTQAWPVLALGFEDLCTRYQLQSSELEAQTAQLEHLSKEAAQRQRRRQAHICARVERLRAVHGEQAHALLRAARIAEALDAKAAPWAPQPLRPEEAVLKQRLRRMAQQLAPMQGRSLSGRCDVLQAAARSRDVCASADAGQMRAQVAPESVQLIGAMLAEQAAALRALAKVLKRDGRDVAILEAQAQKDKEAASSDMRA